MTPWVRRLITTNVVVFLLFMAAGPRSDGFWALTLVPQLAVLRPWTLLTYMFLHAGFWHLALNMLGLYFFGPRLESRMGSSHFLRLYLFGGLGGALFSFLPPMAPVVGASGAVFAVLLGFARYWPHEPIYIWGILPIRARWLILFLAGFSLFAGITQMDDGVAHFAHLGGFAGALVYLWARARRRRRVKQRMQGVVKARPEAEMRRKWELIRVDELHELNRAEVISLLRKVQSFGARSLTVDERAFLDRMVP